MRIIGGALMPPKSYNRDSDRHDPRRELSILPSISDHRGSIPMWLWFYLFGRNGKYPDALSEIKALAELDKLGKDPNSVRAS